MRKIQSLWVSVKRQTYAEVEMKIKGIDRAVEVDN